MEVRNAKERVLLYQLIANHKEKLLAVMTS
jgi:hypothetical protein